MIAAHPALSSHPEQQYLDLLRTLLTSTDRPDRTGTGVRGIFDYRMEFDLAHGFPLLTTKKQFFRGMVTEILWFISGSTDVRVLQEQRVNFWDSWQGDDGTIGYGYGKQMRNQEFWTALTPKVYEPEPWDDVVEVRSVYGVGYYGCDDKKDPFYQILVDTWRQMLRRCYDSTSLSFNAGYGANGVHVDNRWHCFANFQSDARKLPNWPLKAEFPSQYSIDKDTLWASNRYAPHTVMWACDQTQNANRCNTAFFTAVDPAGNTKWMTSIGSTKRDYDLNVSAVHRCLNGKLRTHHGWSDFQYIECPPGQVLRYMRVDQLLNLFCGLKHEPFGRRHIMTLWNPGDLGRTTLPPCHGSLVQFYVENDGRLSLKMNQRSADAFLGLPVNIASYALLLTMFASALDRQPGRFIWDGGDVHLYSNHVEQAQEQVSRVPRPFPQLAVAKRLDLDSWSIGDFTVTGYEPHPHIAGDVAR